jgi:uncharacterized membrane protein YqaE (UPF0057 family)
MAIVRRCLVWKVGSQFHRNTAMLYLLAVIFPPAAVLLCGKPIQAALNCVLTLCFWIPGLIHALFVVSSYHADNRTDRIVSAMQQRRR